jgi:hypothetical protein
VNACTLANDAKLSNLGCFVSIPTFLGGLKIGGKRRKGRRGRKENRGEKTYQH